MGMAIVVLYAPHALACPNCPLGVQARSEVWNDNFTYYLVVALLPFVMVGLICRSIELLGAGGLLPQRLRRLRLLAKHSTVSPQSSWGDRL